MRPYTVETIGGKEVRTTWPEDKARVVMNRLRDEARSELRVEECAKLRLMAEHQPELLQFIQPVADGEKDEDGNPIEFRIVPGQVVKDESTGDPRYVVDPTASRLKHSGADLTDRFREKWVDFCKEPRDFADVVDLPVYAKKAGVTQALKSPVVGTPASEVDRAKPKRKPARTSGKL